MRSSWYYGEQAFKKKSKHFGHQKNVLNSWRFSSFKRKLKKIWELDNIALRKSDENGLIEIWLRSEPKVSEPKEWETPREITSKYINL